MTIKCRECGTEWDAELSPTMPLQICPNPKCSKRAADLALPWVANELDLEVRRLRGLLAHAQDAFERLRDRGCLCVPGGVGPNRCQPPCDCWCHAAAQEKDACASFGGCGPMVIDTRRCFFCQTPGVENPDTCPNLKAHIWPRDARGYRYLSPTLSDYAKRCLASTVERMRTAGVLGEPPERGV